MGKIRKHRKASTGGVKEKTSRPKVAALSEQILQDKSVRNKQRNKFRHRGRDEDDEECVLDAKMSRKILDQARLQQADFEEKHGICHQVSKEASNHFQDDDSEEDEDEWDLQDYPEEITELDPKAEKELARFMSKDTAAQMQDTIKNKITEKKTEIETIRTDNASLLQEQQLDPAIIRLYSKVKTLLQTYRSGKLPLAFKKIPVMSNWKQIMHLTEPETWSAAAMYEATRMFASNLKGRQVQKFYSSVLLPRVRDDIAEYKRLNYHLYQAVKKALYKPQAFNKGFLIPLCASGDCTLREAIIISSILAKCSIPMLHSGGAMLRIASLKYSGSNSIFLRALLDKKYALPTNVVIGMVEHFLRNKNDEQEFPVLWHQCLLTFVQRYKHHISKLGHTEALLDLLRYKHHPAITPDIRRELLSERKPSEEEDSSSP